MHLKESRLPAESSLFVFTDGSVDVKTGIGYGACLIVPNLDTPLKKLKECVQVKRFENSSSTRMELEALLWALTYIPNHRDKIEIYTDSQNIIGLPGRRKRLEKAGYCNKNNKLIKNHDLYRAFYKMNDILGFTISKVTGHQPQSRKDIIHRLFSLVDKASRKALRLSVERAIRP